MKASYKSDYGRIVRGDNMDVVAVAPRARHDVAQQRATGDNMEVVAVAQERDTMSCNRGQQTTRYTKEEQLMDKLFNDPILDNNVENDLFPDMSWEHMSSSDSTNSTGSAELTNTPDPTTLTNLPGDHLGALLDNSPGGVAYAERGAYGAVKVLFASRSLAEMLGYGSSGSLLAALAENPFAGMAEDDIGAVKALITKAVSGDGRFKHTFRCAKRTGDEIWLMLQGSTVAEEGRQGIYAYISDVTAEIIAEKELRFTAYYDSLTGLYNRSAFIKNAQEMLDANPLTEYSMMRMDINSFKVINDIYGRAVGDRILIKIADVLRELIGRNGVYARLFADNFAVMIPYAENSIHPQVILDSIQKGISEDCGINHDIHIYIGVYKITDRSLTADNMIDRASIACRSIVGSFREHIAYYGEGMRRKLLEEQEIRDESRQALQNGEFYVCYQPIYGIKAKKFVSAEALVRWNHPTKGQIHPAKFIPVFEKNGFVAELDLYVLEQVCIYMKKRADLGLPPFPISVNVSRMSLYNPNLFTIIKDLTTKYKVDPQYFRIEITESAYNDNPAQLLDTVGRLREKCYPVLMDDFGSGYSSLNTLKDIPIDILKLDMKFMEGFEKNAKVGTIVTAIARMSKWLNVPLLAEGVETKEQYDFLVSVGCSYIQGFYFSRPVPESDFTGLVSMEEVSASGELIENVGIDFNINELLGSNPIVSKFINSAFGGLGIYEMTGDRLELIRANDGYMEIMGYSVDDFNGENVDVWSRVHPDDVEKAKNACLEAMRNDKAVRAVVRRYGRGGKLLYLDGIHRRLGGTDENPIFCIAFNSINDRIQSDKMIERTTSRVEEVLAATHSMIVDVDFETGEVFLVGDSDYRVNLEHIDVYNAEQTPFAEIVHPDDYEKAQSFHTDLTPGRKSVELRMRRSTDGQYYWWRITIIRHFNPDGRQIRFVATATNINAEISSRLALEQANFNIDAAMNNLAIGIVILEVTDSSVRPNIIFSNDIFWRIIGKEKGTAEDFFESVHSGVSEADIQRVTESVRSGAARMEYRVVRGDGKEAWIDLTLAPSHIRGNTRTYMAVVSDVTERHISEAAAAARGSDTVSDTASDTDNYAEENVRGAGSGMALVDMSGGVCHIERANDKFYEILGIRRGASSDTQRLSQMISAVLATETGSADLRIRSEGTTSTVRVHVERARSHGGEHYSVTVTDITHKRAETRSRIAERMSYAAEGIYDVIYEINIRAKTMKMVSMPARPDLADNAKPFPLDSILKQWVEKAIHPSDVTEAARLFFSPLNDPDFTDTYGVIRMKHVYGDGEYHDCGIAVVRSKADACMMFVHDHTRRENAQTTKESNEIDRVFRGVMKHTRMAMVEYDCASNRVACSFNLEEYSTPGLTEDGTCANGFGGVFDIHPDDRGDFDAFLKTINETEGETIVSVRMKTADGGYEMRRITGFLKRDSARKPAKLIVAASRAVADVQALKKAGESDSALRKMIGNVPVGIGVFRMENNTPVPVYISDNVYALYGIEKGRSDAPLLPVDKLFEDGGIYDGASGEYALESYHADGSKFWLSVNYRVIEEQGALMLYAALSDASDQVESLRLASNQEAAEQQMYQVLLSETNTILFEYNIATGVLKYFSHDDGGRSATTEIAGVLEDPAEFTLLRDMDRVNFFMMLGELIVDPGSGELPVRIEIDGYPRRYKVFMKSVSDSDGRVYEIIGKMEDAEDEMERLDKIRAKAMYDSLCVNVFNKSTAEELIRTELEQCTGGALLMVDVDDFTRISDSLGHTESDEFLKKFANVVKGVFRDTDIVGRYGNDEFVVFMQHVPSSLAEIKGGIILNRAAGIQLPGHGNVGCSVGVAIVTPENRNYARLLKQADGALNQAKNNGKKCVAVFDPETMTESNYRAAVTEVTSETVGKTPNIILSSNPNSAGSTAMRVFSTMYSALDFNAGVNYALELIGREFNVSRVYIFEDSGDRAYTSAVYEWCNTGVPSNKANLQNISYEHDWGIHYLDYMNDDGIYYCHDVTTIENPALRELFERYGIKSVLECAIAEDRFNGFVGFDECFGNRFWTQDQIDSLVFLSKVLAVFLIKNKLEKNSDNLL